MKFSRLVISMASEDTLIKTILIIVAAIFVIPMLMMLIMVPSFGMWDGAHMWNGTGIGWMWPLMWIVVLGVVLAIGYGVYRGGTSSSAKRIDPALEELRSAYARGELSTEEFEERKERLQADDNAE